MTHLSDIAQRMIPVLLFWIITIQKDMMIFSLRSTIRPLLSSMKLSVFLMRSVFLSMCFR